MLELPGWTRSRLRSASRSDVEAARLRVYAGVLEPTVNFDVENKELDLAEAEASARAAKRIGKQRRAMAREALTKLKVARAEARKLLMLDEEDADA